MDIPIIQKDAMSWMYRQLFSIHDSIHIKMSVSDWNTVASDLQRAVNNLAWFVLETMAVPEQPSFTPLQHLPVAFPSSQPSALLKTSLSKDTSSPSRKRVKKENLTRVKELDKTSVGTELDKLVAETCV